MPYPDICSIPRQPLRRLIVALWATWAYPTSAQEAPATATAPAEIQRIDITGRHYDNSVGSSDAASQGVIRAELLKSRPALRPGEVLEFVPGVIVTQHSGDGKANQYFLRGFNLDHGTDFATSVDGVPVNMPSHAHGQGYSDLNFLIPELVDHIAYRKGPYFATHGDFASAGAADIAYKNRLDAPFGQLTVGESGYRRGLLTGSTALAADGSTAQGTLMGALELMRNDGPWTVPEGLKRANGVLGYSQGTRAAGWGLRLMGYDASWTSTDQVPQRLIDAGSSNGQPFGRFDSLDPTDGGSTSRYSLSGEWHERGDDSEHSVQAYALRYHLKLFSNFTYVQDDPLHGDQFSQQDARTVTGLSARQAWDHSLFGLDARTEIGTQWRHDHAQVGLFHTEARQILDTTRQDDIAETLGGVYAQNQLTLTPWLRSVAGLRADRAWFQVDSLKGNATAAANSTCSRPSSR